MDASDPLAPFSKLRDRDYAREGLLVCEGRIVLEKALEAGLALRAVVCVPADYDEWRDRAPAGAAVSALPKPELEEHIGFSFHRGVLALAERPAPRLAAEAATGGASGLLLPRGPALVLWNVTDPDNLGTLIRSAAALGAAAVYLGGGSADPYGRKALRASMGNALTTPLFFLRDESELYLARGPGENLLVVAALAEGALRPREVSAPGDFTLALGNEGWGLPQGLLAACDRLVELPMASGVDSLNVGAAGAILMWELFGARLR